MKADGIATDAKTNGRILHWQGRVLSAEDLRRNLNGSRELSLSQDAVVTPLAAEELRSNGVRIIRRRPQEQAEAPNYLFAEERPYPLVRGALSALARDGLRLRELPAAGDGLPCRWARAVAECVARGECRGGVVFCDDPGLICCVANKLPGLRAAAAVTIHQAARATLSLGVNLLAVEMPGRTFFEVRQMIRLLCRPESPACPDGAACTLRELDGHAHR